MPLVKLANNIYVNTDNIAYVKVDNYLKLKIVFQQQVIVEYTANTPTECATLLERLGCAK